MYRKRFLFFALLNVGHNNSKIKMNIEIEGKAENNEIQNGILV